MQMHNNSKEKTITIKAELIISLGELATYVLRKGENNYNLLHMLYNKPKVVNRKIRIIFRDIISKKKAKVLLKGLTFLYNDSDNFSHGSSYFEVILRGTEQEIKKIAGDDKICTFDWNDEKNITSEQ